MSSEVDSDMLTVYSINGSTLMVPFPADGSIGSLRASVAESFGVQLWQLRLFRGDSLLPVTGSLAEAGISGACSLEVVLNMPDYTTMVTTSNLTVDDFHAGQVCVHPDGSILVANQFLDFGLNERSVGDWEVFMISEPEDRPPDDDDGYPPCEWRRGMCIGPGGSSVFIASSVLGDHKVRQLSYPDGRIIRELSPTLRYPQGMRLSPDETTLAIADSDSGFNVSHYIVLVRLDDSLAPRFIGGAGGRGDSEFDSPTDVAFTMDGEMLLVADTRNSRVQVFGLNGSFLRTIDVGAEITGIAVDSMNNIIVMTDRVSVYTLEGTVICEQVSDLIVDGFPSLALDLRGGRIVVACRTNDWTGRPGTIALLEHT